ncbi:hypothetical protein IW261DRAFT_1344695, partial [Armillaria novae-zelandiae]
KVATIRYAKEHTSIPVPDVLVYDPDWDRKVGGEWMLMKYPTFGPSFSVYASNPSEAFMNNKMDPKLSDDQWEALCTSVADIWSQLLRLRFKSVGSIYEQQDGSESRYFIGPMTYIPSTGCVASPEASTSGPFSSTREWLVAVAKGKLKSTRRIPSDFDYEQARKWRPLSVRQILRVMMMDIQSCIICHG